MKVLIVRMDYLGNPVMESLEESSYETLGAVIDAAEACREALDAEFAGAP